MINYWHSFRFKLVMVFLIAIVLLTILVMVTLPSYYTKNMNKEIEVLTESTITAVELNMDNYFEELERLTIMPYFNQSFMNSLLLMNSMHYDGLSDYEKFHVAQSIEGTLTNYLQATREDILSSLFVTGKLDSFITTKKYGQTYIKEDYDFEQANWYIEAQQEDSNVVYINAHTQDYLETPVANKVFSVARLIKDPMTMKRLGILMADIDTNIIAKTFKSVNLGVSSIITVYDGDRQLIYATQTLSSDIKKQMAQSSHNEIKDGRHHYRLISRSLKKLPWQVNILISLTEFNDKIRSMYMVGGLILVTELFITFLFFSFMSNRITKPFNQMLLTIEKIKNGNKDIRFDDTGKDEIAYLSTNLNHMMDQINELIHREYQAIIEKKTAEYHALQSQIQPHFLFNTLNGLLGLNRLGERKKIEETVISLTQMMRYILNQQDTSSLREEFKLLDNYCALQKLRFGDRMNYTLDLAEDVEEVGVPKLLLQPLVENAIIHGLEPMSREGYLVVRAYKENRGNQGSLHILVEDNGIGFSTASPMGTGLTNIKNRLVLIYPHHKLSVSSKEGYGTYITIEIPLEEQGHRQGEKFHENFNCG